MRPLTLQDMRQWADDHNGKCLSKQYWDRDTDLTWRCDRGHVFDMRPMFVQRGAWCPQCTLHDKKIAALELMQEWAEKRGGKCLSTQYINNTTPLQWECKNGHKFKKNRDYVKQQKNWCYECQQIEPRKHKLKQIQKIAAKRHGKCLSDTYVDLITKLVFECKQGHKWKATPHIIIYSNSWCPQCYGHLKQTIGDMQKLAAMRNGKCLSKKYKGSQTPLKWQCEKGHTWTTPPSNVSSGTWCPKCHLIRVKTTDIVKRWTKGAKLNR